METEISSQATSLLFVDSAPQGRGPAERGNLGLLNAWEKSYFPLLFCVFLVHLLQRFLVPCGHGIEKGWQSLLI